MTFYDFLPYIGGSIIPIGITIGTLFFAVRWGYSKQAVTTQAATITALTSRVESLEAQSVLDQKEITRLRQESKATRFALKRIGLHIEIKDGFITLVDAHTKRSHTMSMRSALRINNTPPDDVTTSDEADDEEQDSAS